MRETDPAETAAPQEDAAPAELSPALAPPEEPAPDADEPGGELPEEDASSSDGAGEAPGAPTPEPLGRLDERRLYLVAAGVAAFLLLVILALFWQSRRDVAVLRDELAAVRLQARRSELLHQQSTLLRVRADLQGLRQSLPADLAVEVDKADGVLAGLADRLRASR